MSASPRHNPPSSDPEATQSFTPEDVAELRALLAKNIAAAQATRPKPRPTSHAAPPNLGNGLAAVIVVTVLALCAVAVVFGYLLLH